MHNKDNIKRSGFIGIRLNEDEKKLLTKIMLHYGISSISQCIRALIVQEAGKIDARKKATSW